MARGFLGLFGGDPGRVRLAQGQVLFKKGDPAKHLYVVEAGQLEVVENDRVLETIGEDDIVGEMALIDGSTRSATVRATVASKVIQIDEKRFLRMVSETPFFALRVMRVLTARLRAMNEHQRKA
jgi:CRP-like cAMP-binding protein